MVPPDQGSYSCVTIRGRNRRNPFRSVRSTLKMSFKSKNKDPGDKKHQGFVSSLFHRHSDDNEKNAKAAKSTTLAKSPETPPQFPRVDATSSKPELAGKPEPSSTAPPIKPPPTTSVPAKKGRREESEKRLEDAAVALSKSMSKSPIELPDAIGLQHLGNIKDVEGTAKQLESAVDGIIDKRQIKANADSRRVWKDCIKHWFKAIYPYVNFGLEQVKASFPSFYVDYSGFCSHTVWVCCQRRALYSRGSLVLALG